LSTLAVVREPAAGGISVCEREMTKPASMPHIKALDGVRGLAFVMVYVQHFTGGNHIHVRAIEAFRGVGWTGVDLFFCLSGFLITGILYDTQSDAKYYKNFYGRRALRIFPLFYLCLLLIFMMTPLLHLQWHLYHLCYPLYCSNFLNALMPNVDTFSFQPWIDLGHFWSLAVEEQFYIVWPIAILWCATRRRIVTLCVSLIGMSIALRLLFVLLYLHAIPVNAVYASHWYVVTLGAMKAPFFYRMFLYRITFFRLDALAMGGIVAMLLRGCELERWAGWLKWMAVAIILATGATIFTSFHLETPWTAVVGYTLLAMLFAMAIVGAIHSKSVGVFFQARYLMEVGKYSYAMYLLHQIARPAMPLLIHRIAPKVGSVGIAAVLCSSGWFVCLYGLARLSFRLFESRFLRMKDRFAYATK
jgi:peptidoglycan/LPS O-acetylase OafA/YrhL